MIAVHPQKPQPFVTAAEERAHLLLGPRPAGAELWSER